MNRKSFEFNYQTFYNCYFCSFVLFKLKLLKFGNKQLSRVIKNL